MKCLALIFGIFIVIVVVLADTRHLGFLCVVYDFPFGDKAGHFLLFGLLSLVVNLSILESGHPSVTSIQPDVKNKCALVKTSLILALFVGLEEFSQRWFPARSSDWFDLSASYLGIALFAVLAFKIKTRWSLQM